MPLYTDVCRTQCDVTLDTTIPETLANYTPVLRDCECHNCAVNQSQAVTGSSIDQSDSVFHMSNTFSDESIDVVFEEPDIPSLQSVDIMPSQSYFEMTEGSYVKLSSAVVAILVGGLKCRTQFWKGTTQESFQQSLVEIGSVVSDLEEKIFF